MTGNEKSALMAERTEALAIVHLTRRNDLIVTRQSHDYGFDLLVEVKKNDARTGRFFWVQTKTLPARHLERIKENPESYSVKDSYLQRLLPDIPFPLLCLTFAMDTDQGYYAWLVEPVVGRGGKLHLGKGIFKPLDNESLNQIIETVNTWYDERMKIPA